MLKEEGRHLGQDSGKKQDEEPGQAVCGCEGHAQAQLGPKHKGKPPKPRSGDGHDLTSVVKGSSCKQRPPRHGRGGHSGTSEEAVVCDEGYLDLGGRGHGNPMLVKDTPGPSRLSLG